MENVDFSLLLQDYKLILSGIYTTIYVSVFSSVLAFCIGVVFVYWRTSKNLLAGKFSNFLVSCIRNTPLLIIIYLFYKGLPSVNIVLPAEVCGILALGFYTAAYVSDALLTGINAVPAEHFQSSESLGLSRLQAFISVIFPQSLSNSVLILGSTFMNLVKNSSLVSFIAVTDIFYVVYKGISDSYRIYEYFTLAVVLYCALTGFVLLVTNVLNNAFKLRQSEVNL